MRLISAAGEWILLASWIVFSSLLAANHVRVRNTRRRLGIPEEKPSIRDPRSMHGLLFEGLGFLVAFAFARTPHSAAGWQCAASIFFGILSVGVLAASLRHLGLEWRVKAVVTEDHQLITEGPYSIVRHPIFAALICLLMATVLLLNDPLAAIGALAVCLFGTEIRIRAEDRLLERRFGALFSSYRRRVAAYVPYVR